MRNPNTLEKERLEGAISRALKILAKKSKKQETCPHKHYIDCLGTLTHTQRYCKDCGAYYTVVKNEAEQRRTLELWNTPCDAPLRMQRQGYGF